MTRFELAYAIEDTLGVDASALHGLPRPRASIGNTPDVLVGRQLDTSEAFLVPYRVEVRKLAERAAERIARGCERSDPEACVIAALREPASRLFRATLADSELRAMASAALATPPRAHGLAEELVRQLLESPRFYRVTNELPGRASSDEQAARLAQRRRLASRLALALHSSVPDYDLLRRAEHGELDASPALAREVARLLDDPRFSRFSREFTRQWLRIDRAPIFRTSLATRTLLQDAPRFAALEQQAATFFGALLERQAPPRELLAGDDGGLLATGAISSALSTPIRGGGDESWLGRGLVIQSSLLCRTFPLAAVYSEKLWWDHPLLDPKAAETTPRPGERELLRTRTTDRPCRECHRQLEPLGAVLAGRDAFGAPTTADVEPVTFAGRALTGPSDLARAILDSGRFEPCVAEKLTTYLLGRAVLPDKRAEDRCMVESLAGPLGRPSDSSLKSWVAATVGSPAFREPGAEVVHDVPTPSPDPNGYRVMLPPQGVDAAACASFDPGRFLARSCGSAACHGLGAAITPFAVPDVTRARALLLAARPHPDGYCTAHERLLDPQHPRESLVIQKVVAGAKVCGSVMPISGGPRLLSELDRACFVRWVEEVATAAR
jgi:hypothetical protein